MLFILRKIRRSFFLPGKVRTYMAYAAGEIVLIVVGIMIALEANEWKQERRDRAEETAILVRLKPEFETNQELLAKTESQVIENVNGMVEFLTLFDPKPEAHPDEQIHGYIKKLFYIPHFIPNSEVIDSLSASGKLGLINNEKLSYQLSAWPRYLGQYKEWLSFPYEERLIAWNYVLDYHQLRDTQIGRKDGWSENTGPSRFDYSQSELLANPKIESFVEQKRIVIEISLGQLNSIQQIQQEILDLIDAELHASR